MTESLAVLCALCVLCGEAKLQFFADMPRGTVGGAAVFGLSGFWGDPRLQREGPEVRRRIGGQEAARVQQGSAAMPA